MHGWYILWIIELINCGQLFPELVSILGLGVFILGLVVFIRISVKEGDFIALSAHQSAFRHYRENWLV